MDRQIRYKKEEQVNAGILELLEESSLPTSDLDQLNSKITFISAYLNDSEELVGIVGLEWFGEEAILRSLAVRKEYQKKGLGKGLVDRLEEYANGEAVSDLYLLTETAQSFFEQLNYSVIPRRSAPQNIQRSSQFSQLCASTAICMCKKLSG